MAEEEVNGTLQKTFSQIIIGKISQKLSFFKSSSSPSLASSASTSAFDSKKICSSDSSQELYCHIPREEDEVEDGKIKDSDDSDHENDNEEESHSARNLVSEYEMKHVLPEKSPAGGRKRGRSDSRCASLLSNDELTCVFSFLSPMELCECCSVCRAWLYASESDCLWMPVFVRLLPHIHSDFWLPTEKMNYKSWLRLLMLKCSIKSAEAKAIIAKKCADSKLSVHYTETCCYSLESVSKCLEKIVHCLRS